MSSENYGDALTPDEVMGSWSSLQSVAGIKNAAEFINSDTGERMVVGRDGGAIHFLAGGKVKALWDRKAALAADHGSGNRKVRVTSAGDKRAVPELDELFNMVAACRRYWSCDGSICPADPCDAESETFKRAFNSLAWRMLRAVGNGDAEELEAVAHHLRNFEMLQDESQALGLAKWIKVAEAVENAASNCGGVPRKSEVAAQHEKLCAQDVSMDMLKQALSRMGYAWLPGGRKRKTALS